MSHLPFFGIENFRVFKENTKLNLKPISLLIGANSTGKSSLNKAILLFYSSFVNAKLEFEDIENSLQLGGIDNSVTWDSTEQNLSFTLPFQVNNFPILGETGSLDCKIIISQSNIIDYEFYHQNDLLVAYNSERILFNFYLFFNTLNLPEKHTISRLKDHGNSALLYNIHQENYAIIDKREKTLKKINKPTLKPDDKHLPFRIIFQSKSEKEVYEIAALYNKSIAFEDAKKLELLYDNDTDIITNFGVETNNFRTNFDWAYNPLKELCSEFEFSPFIINFINEEIFGNFFTSNREINSSPAKNRFYSDMLDLINNTVYHKGILERPKRIYQYGETGELSDFLQKFIKHKSRKSVSFLKKWSGQEGFLFLGEINLNDNTKQAFRSITIGLTSIANEGQGISQLVSLLLDICSSEKKIFLIEEPESFLHPSYQSKLADFFIDAQKTFKHQFIIETHSEYLIRKLQYLIAKENYKAEDVVIYNFRKATEENLKIVKRININHDGSLTSSFYPGFFDEAIGLELELLRLKRGKSNLN